jgi:hypothetical protein
MSATTPKFYEPPVIDDKPIIVKEGVTGDPPPNTDKLPNS